MICKSCGEDNKHTALGLCMRCYNAEYRSNHTAEIREYRMANRDASLASMRRYRYAHGGKPASENKQCPVFLGVHVAEQVLSKVFKDVKQMPPNNPGYDFRCNKGKQIDVKSSCTRTHNNRGDRWMFHINKNRTADFFLCIAFDNREDLNPLHIWLIPGNIVNHLMSASITESALPKWDEYKLDITKTLKCCNSMKSH